MQGTFTMSFNKETKKFKSPRKQDSYEFGKEKTEKTREREKARREKRERWNEFV